ncbi:MAG: hypothetical protein K0U74_04925 [Alphaproteobacteria bacterium]|nr:hypothetical protein [Alphaproteobacteria bacterium]
MKTFFSIIAAAALVASATAAQADYASDFFEQQHLYGENVATDIFAEQQLYGENVSDIFIEQQLYGENTNSSVNR